MKKSIWIIVGIILTIIIVEKFDSYINIEFLIGNEFNLITINTVLVGFLFTIYTILIPLLSEEALKSYTKTGEINSVFKHITRGIVSGTLSVIFTIIGLAMFKVEKDITILKVHKIWLGIEIMFFLVVIFSTLLSIINISTIVEDVRCNKENLSKKQDVDEEMKRRFKDKK